jgi:predicted transcriptional regulator
MKEVQMDEKIELHVSLPKNTFRELRKMARRQHKSETDLAEAAIEEYIEKENISGKLIGLFASEPELIDQILDHVMNDREKVPLRLDC